MIEPRETKEWTLMFYFASDNPLAISIVSQLKALKAAGFHQKANVVAQFDPYTPGTPTHIFDVNLVNKLKAHGAHNIGFVGNDPFVRNMIEDKLWGDEKTSTMTVDARSGEPESVREALKRVLRERDGIDYNPPIARNGKNGSHAETLAQGETLKKDEEPDPEKALTDFLSFCADEYPARHYMLFILGHGVVVGNDIFLLDEHASKQALTLSELGGVLTGFKQAIERQDATLELISFHSCSVSSLEVAYELQGTANYMLASQGPTFVGSWPYRQILIRIFNDLEDQGRNIDVKKMLVKIFHYCLFNATDFLLAGYSFQLTLCDLTKLSKLKGPMESLSAALVEGLSDPLSKDFILLSHWKSQSFYNEMFSDVYDFCFCLSNKITEFISNPGITLTPKLEGILKGLNKACDDVMDQLVKENPKKEGDPYNPRFIVAADSLGPAFQYSRGLSVYFPWAEPSEDSGIMPEYAKYKFHTGSSEPNKSWLAFLQAYFGKTMRDVSRDEHDSRRYLPKWPEWPKVNKDDALDEDIASLVYASEGPLGASALAGPKSDPMDKTGFEAESVTIKNYPRDTRSRNKRKREAARRFPLSETFGIFERNNSNNNH